MVVIIHHAPCNIFQSELEDRDLTIKKLEERIQVCNEFTKCDPPDPPSPTFVFVLSQRPAVQEQPAFVDMYKTHSGSLLSELESRGGRMLKGQIQVRKYKSGVISVQNVCLVRHRSL